MLPVSLRSSPSFSVFSSDKKTYLLSNYDMLSWKSLQLALIELPFIILLNLYQPDVCGKLCVWWILRFGWWGYSWLCYFFSVLELWLVSGSGSWECGVAAGLQYPCTPVSASYPLFSNVMIKLILADGAAAWPGVGFSWFFLLRLLCGGASCSVIFLLPSVNLGRPRVFQVAVFKFIFLPNH